MAENIGAIGAVPSQAAQALPGGGRKNAGTAELSGTGGAVSASASKPLSGSAQGANVSYFPPEQSDGAKAKNASEPNYFPPKSTSSSAQDRQAETTHVQFSRDKDTGESLIQFVDSGGHVVEQIPPKQLLETITELCKTAGILVNKSV